MPDQVDGSARRAIRNTLKSYVPRTPLTLDAETRVLQKWEIGKTLAVRSARRLTTFPRKASGLERNRAPPS
ncbi:hypothetical protein GCM10011391_15610 [Pullulanibacillus camelliae]|uniref:Uncharacterized protein n=1 Tax=Pullulanibacillus camelliae TaxID=1707096 RepID=A0A8J2VQ81_9BACL|nr:hypothetical protein GCM10011391_15610 [Pullulanibacillus camelliae]